jgi:hypothetical protein
MSKEENQQSQVSIETSYDKAELKKPAAATHELSENDHSQTESKPVENNGEDGLKALARLMMVSLTWSMAGLSQRK